MRNNHWFIVLPLCLLFTLPICKEASADSQTLSIVLSGDTKAVAALEKAIKDNPKIIIPQTRTEYSINIIKPKPNIDYKIVEIIPDPTIDYDIIIINPDARRPRDILDRWLGPELRKKLPKRHKNRLD